MILLRRLNGTELGVNADLIERVETTPDTVITLVDGTKYIVAEPATEVVARIVEFRARILATAEAFADADHQADASKAPSARAVPLRLVEGDALTATDGATGAGDEAGAADGVRAVGDAAVVTGGRD